ncbi:hypothetical protein B0T19DRAFT_1750 [Cercophora scortea]|uniref:Uncharacterized protein n=1 Tax=Cercophora scortea TaxID=314031 RepID=A0AAE0J1F7_9PEZI|nr:hypothetical protein B0T19DRAFT_1750 [Cercophora scortea]
MAATCLKKHAIAPKQQLLVRYKGPKLLISVCLSFCNVVCSAHFQLQCDRAGSGQLFSASRTHRQQRWECGASQQARMIQYLTCRYILLPLPYYVPQYVPVNWMLNGPTSCKARPKQLSDRRRSTFCSKPRHPPRPDAPETPATVVDDGDRAHYSAPLATRDRGLGGPGSTTDSYPYRSCMIAQRRELVPR